MRSVPAINGNDVALGEVRRQSDIQAQGAKSQYLTNIQIRAAIEHIANAKAKSTRVPETLNAGNARTCWLEPNLRKPTLDEEWFLSSSISRMIETSLAQS